MYGEVGAESQEAFARTASTVGQVKADAGDHRPGSEGEGEGRDTREEPSGNDPRGGVGIIAEDDEGVEDAPGALDRAKGVVSGGDNGWGRRGLRERWWRRGSCPRSWFAIVGRGR